MILRDIWETTEGEPPFAFSLSEASGEASEVDGKAILGVVEGQMFVPDGTSRNKRFYSRAMWEHVLARPEVRERLESRTMYGGIGHDARPVTEKDIAEGRVSHIVTKLWINEQGKGMGQAMILGTETGRNLFCCLRAKSKLKTSTRADGKYESSKSLKGVPVVDKHSYILETVDFVIKPGFLQTDPQLLENENNTNENNMDPITEQLLRSRDTLQEQFLVATTRVSILEGENKDKDKQIVALEEASENSPKFPDGFARLCETLNIGSDAILDAIVGVDPKTLKMVFEGDLSGEIYEKYSALGSPEDITAAVTVLSEFEVVGAEDGETVSPEELQEALDEALEVLQKYTSVGAEDGETVSPEDLQEALDEATEVLRSYTELGTLDELSSMKTDYEERLSESTERDRADLVTRLSGKHKVDVKLVEKLVERFDGDENLVEEVLASKTSRSYRSSSSMNEDGDGDGDRNIGPAARPAGRFFESLTHSSSRK